MTWSERKLERTTMHVEAIYRFQAFVYSEWTASIDALIITRTGSTDAFVPIQSLLFPMFVCDRWIRCRSHRQRSLQREEKDDQMVIFVTDVSVFHFLFFFFGTISDCKSLSLDRSSRLCSLTIAIGKLFFFRIEKFVEKLF